MSIPAHYNEDEYHEGLYGEPAMRAVAASVENNEIIASIRPQPMYETFLRRPGLSHRALVV